MALDGTNRRIPPDVGLRQKPKRAPEERLRLDLESLVHDPIPFFIPMRFTKLFFVSLILLCVSASGQEAKIPARLTLADALHIAETANPSFRAARNLVGIAEADAREAASRPNPEIAVEGEEYSIFGPTLPSFLNGQALILRMEQEIETAGRRVHRMKAADAGIEVARSEVADGLRQLQLEVGKAYFQLVLAQANQSTARAALKDIERVISLTEARFKVGEVAGTELRRLQVERLHFFDQVLTTELAVTDARLVLLKLLGAADLRQRFEAIDPLEPPPLRSPDGGLIATAEGVAAELNSLRRNAASTRPDLRTARLTRERAEAEMALQQARRAPNITVAWGYRRDFGEHAMDFEVSIPIPLFGSLNPAGVQRAFAERRRAKALEKAAKITVDSELQQAANAVDSSARRVRYIDQEYLRSSRELHDLIRASYELGETALIDFLDVQREFIVTQQVRNQALYDLRISLIGMAAAVGISPTGQP